MMRGLLVLTLWWALIASSVAGQLLRVNAQPEFDTLRLSLELSAPTQFRYSLLDKPDRLVVDLTTTEAASSLNTAAAQTGPIAALRHSQNGKNLKLVFELNSSTLVKAYKLKAAQQQPDRVVLELSGFKTVTAPPSKPAPVVPVAPVKELPAAKPAVSVREPSAAAPTVSKPAEKPIVKPVQSSVAEANGLPEVMDEDANAAKAKPQKSKGDIKPAPAAAQTSGSKEPTFASAKGAVQEEATAQNVDLLAGNKAAEPAKQESQPPIRGRKIIVALDAGHGGKDTGAVGPRGLREKDVVLAIARDLANLLQLDGRYKVVMTRSGDQFIPLKGRRDKARKLKADVFISIHADAFVNPLAKGASVFALSQRGATSEMARFLAEHENSSDMLGSVGGVSLDDKDEMLAGVLVDLSMTATLANSLDLGARVLKELGRMAQLHNRSVEQAGFVVLKSPDVPSILVETGFISNPEEAAKLGNPAYRHKLAQAIFKGVNNYFATQGPPIAQSSSSEPRQAEPRQAEPRQAEPRQAAPVTPTPVRPDTPKIDPRADSRARSAAPAPPVVAASKPAAAKKQSHRVDKGDTLEKIARRYGVSQKAIMQANGMAEATVKLGQTLQIPVP